MLKIKHFMNLLKDMPYGFRLDKIMFHRTTNYPGHGSTQWHRDSVGSRIKIFIILDADSKCPETIIFPCSNHELPYSMNIDIVRTLMGRCDENQTTPGLTNQVQSMLETSLGKRFSEFPIRLTPKTGDIIIFDTNSWHKGWKPCMNEEEPSDDSRLVLEFEYMDRESSNYCVDFLGPCAPGQTFLSWNMVDWDSPINIDLVLNLFRFDKDCIHIGESYGANQQFIYSTLGRLRKWPIVC
jgi:hypothetical protein